MPISFDANPALKRVTVTVPAGTRWASFEQSALAAITETPEMTDWMWIINDKGPIEDIDVAGMIRVGEAFQRLARDPLRRTYTVVVTTDRFFGLWGPVLDLNHGSRKHHAAPTLAAATALLDALEASD